MVSDLCHQAAKVPRRDSLSSPSLSLTVDERVRGIAIGEGDDRAGRGAGDV